LPRSPAGGPARAATSRIPVERVATTLPRTGHLPVRRVAARVPRRGRLPVERVTDHVPHPGRLAVERVVATPPRPQSLAVASSGDPHVGRTDDGLVTVADGVVAKIASRAAVEVPDAGAAGTRLLGRELHGPGLGHLGVRRTSLDDLPKCSAQVDGTLAFLSLTLSIRYPAPVRTVAATVRSHVATRVLELTGLTVREVDIDIPALVTELPSLPRVR